MRTFLSLLAPQARRTRTYLTHFILPVRTSRYLLSVLNGGDLSEAWVTGGYGRKPSQHPANL